MVNDGTVKSCAGYLTGCDISRVPLSGLTVRTGPGLRTLVPALPTNTAFLLANENLFIMETTGHELMGHHDADDQPKAVEEIVRSRPQLP